MTTAFPGSLDAYVRPGGGDALSVGPHSAHHDSAYDAIEAIEQKLGIDNSTDPESIDYRLGVAEDSITDAETDIADLQGDVTTLQTDTAALALLVANLQTGSYTLVLSDQNKVVEVNSASAANVTVPPNADVAFPVGTVIEVLQYGAGQVTLVAGSGVTIRSPGGKYKTVNQYSAASLRKRGTNEWVLSGDLTA